MAGSDGQGCAGASSGETPPGDGDDDAVAALFAPPLGVAAGETLRHDAGVRGWRLISGWAGEVVRVDEERRQVVDILLPGDFCLPPAPGHELIALSPVTARALPDTAPGHGAAITQLVLAAAIAQNRRLRQQVARNGRRTACERVAHLLLELCERLRIEGKGPADTLYVPVGQSTIADAVGLSYVHVSRVLNRLERSGMIERTRTRIAIQDRPGLVALSGFDGAYVRGAP